MTSSSAQHSFEPADLESEGLRRPGKPLVFTLTANDIISLAINVIQNGWSYGELPLLTGQLSLQRRDAPMSRDMRLMLEQVYAELLRPAPLQVDGGTADRATRPRRRKSGRVRRASGSHLELRSAPHTSGPSGRDGKSSARGSNHPLEGPARIVWLSRLIGQPEQDSPP